MKLVKKLLKALVVLIFYSVAAFLIIRGVLAWTQDSQSMFFTGFISFVVGSILVLIGSILFTYLYKIRKKTINKKSIFWKILSYILLGLYILTYCAIVPVMIISITFVYKQGPELYWLAVLLTYNTLLILPLWIRDFEEVLTIYELIKEDWTSENIEENLIEK